jgi:hypothetical protein
LIHLFCESIEPESQSRKWNFSKGCSTAKRRMAVISNKTKLFITLKEINLFFSDVGNILFEVDL